MRLFLFALACALATPLAAAAEKERGTISFILENDAFYGPDRNYTQGLQLNYMRAEPSEHGCLLRRLTNAVGVFDNGRSVRCGYGVGQSIFTPRDLTASAPLPDQRPYAGWLYLNFMYTLDRGAQLDTVQLNVGVVGPDAFAEFAQNEWHDRILDIDEAQGWDNQLRDEPGVALKLERRWKCRHRPNSSCLLDRIFGNDVADYVSIDPHIGMTAGNVHTHASAGATMRVGFSLDTDYGPPRIRPALGGSHHFDPNSAYFKETPLGPINFYVFAGVEGRAVARNIFLDGNSWRDSLSVDKRHLVGDLQAGAALQLGRLQLSYTHILRTKEYKGQVGKDRFGAVAIQFKAFHW